MEKKMLIAISRQYGSGGREVAEILAKKLNVKRYDRKIVAMAADVMEQTHDVDDALRRSYNAPENCLGNIGDYAFERVARHNRMYVEQAKIIIDIAKKGSAVFLGRCADYILRDDPDMYSFFIYADDDFRAQRAKEKYPGYTLKDLDKEEQRRKQYYEYYTGRTWGDPQNYDLMINAAKMPLADVADFILAYIEKNCHN